MWIVIDNHRNLSIVTSERPCRPLSEHTMSSIGFCSDWIVRCLYAKEKLVKGKLKLSILFRIDFGVMLDYSRFE